MKFLLFCYAFCALTLTLSAQNKTFKINPGQKIVDVIPQDELYSYATFTPGTILFKNGNFAKALMNYNVYYETIEFINTKGDTLAIADESIIKMITMKEDTFYYSKTYVKAIADYGDLLLAEKQFFSISNREKIGAMGTTTSASVDTHNAIRNKEVAKDLVVQEVLTLRKSNILFIGNKFQYFLPVNKKNLMEMYGTRQKEVSNYLKEKTVQFSSEKDIKLLMTHFNK
jgi:hypothetical protein